MKRKLAQKVISFVCAVSVMMQIAAPAFAAGTDTLAPASETAVETQVVEEEPKVDEESIVVEELQDAEPAAPEEKAEEAAAPEVVAEPEVQGTSVQMQLAAGDQNGNGHFGKDNTEAFVLSSEETKYTKENFSFTMKLNSEKNASRFRFVTKYVSDTEWGYIAYDGMNSHWFYEYQNGNYADLNGLPAVKTGDVVKVSGKYTDASLEITVTNTTTGESATATVNKAEFLALKDKPGQIGFGAAKLGNERTDVTVSELVIGTKAFAQADYSAMIKYKGKDFTWVEQTAQPEPEVPAEEFRYVLQNTNGVGGSHNYSQNGGPAAALYQGETDKDINKISMEVSSPSTQSNAPNIGIFYNYKDDNNFLYVGYDPMSKWYYECHKTGKTPTYHSFGGDLAPLSSEPVQVEVTLNGNALSITVNEKTQTMDVPMAAELVTALKKETGVKVGVMAKTNTKVEFANVKVNDKALADKWAMLFAGNGTLEKKSATDPAAPVSVSGKVVDANDAAVAGATVTLAEGKTATTNAEGAFTLADVAAGSYTLTVSKEGYQEATKDITVRAENLAVGNIVLTPNAPIDPNSKLWYQLKGNGGSGHSYGSVPGPATAVYQDQPAKFEQTLSLELMPTTDDFNFGVFYYYLDNNNWLYIGLDGTNHWYFEYRLNGQGEYPALGGLPAPKKGVKQNISISMGNEVLSVTVDGVKKTVNNQKLQELGNKIKGNNATKFGVMTKGHTSVEFANVQVDNKALNDSWALLQNPNGTLTKRYAKLVTVSGKVVDKDNNPMPDAVVRVADRKTTTGSDGTYTLEKMETGSYTLAVSKPGYKAVSQELSIEDQDVKVDDVQLLLKNEIDFDATYATIENDTMKVYVGKQFPQVAKYVMKDGSGEMLGQVEEKLNKVSINNQEINAETVSADITGDTATYVLRVNNGLGINCTMTVVVSIEANTLTWRVKEINKAEGCNVIATIAIPGLNLVTVTDLEAVQASEANKPYVGFAGASKSTNTTVSGDVYIGFEDGQGFQAGEKTQYLYGIVTNGKLSASLFSNSEAEGDRRVLRSNGADCISLSSAPWYYERGDKAAQGYNPGDIDTLTFPKSELPVAKVALASDLNDDKIINWNDGAIAFRDIYNIPQGSEVVKDTVNHRIVMNFASMAPNPYLETADNIRKVYLATDGLPQAVVLKGYGNEGHDSANSEYADIAEREGGVKDFQKLIQIAHKYSTEVGVHVNAQEAYPEANSFSDRLLAYEGWGGHGWGWLDQSHVIDKMWDLTSGNRWARMVQFYDRINGTNFNSAQWPAVAATGKVADMDTLRADAANRPDNMDFIYLDVWYQDAWETRRIAEQFNSLGWRFSTEFSDQGEYDSTWQHWATDAKYGGAGMKGFNSEIIRFIRNDQRDSQVLNFPEFGGTADNPLLGGYRLYGFEGWGGDQDYNRYIEHTYAENVPTRFLQQYKVIKWEDYEKGQSPVGNQEKQITLKDEAGNVVVVTRNEEQRHDEIIERTVTLNGKVVLEDDAYLLPWKDYQGAQDKLYHWNNDGGETTWQLTGEFANAKTLYCYQLTDQGRVNEQVIKVKNGSITLNAEAKTPYVLVRNPEIKKLVDDFGAGDYVADPGFNGYADGAALNLDHWTGTTEVEGVKVKKAVTGDQNLVFGASAQDISVSTEIRGLEPGKHYVAEIYVDNKSDSKATVSVNTGSKTEFNYTYRSIAGNYIQCDEGHLSGNYDSKLQWIQVPFVAEGTTATFTLEREAGAGEVFWDDIRIVEKELNNFREDGTFVQDFETVVQGLYPFVLGSAQGVSDPRTHLAQRNGKFTQSGWQDKTIDDVLNGNWSLKHHENNVGIIYQTIPQNFRFEPGKVYEVSFNYQSGREAYAMVVGNGTKYTVPTAYLPATAGQQGVENGATTKQHVMYVQGDGNGQTWIGLYSKGTGKGNDMGERDFILDDLVIREMEESEAGVTLTAEKNHLYKGEAVKVFGMNMKDVTFENSNPDVASFDEATMTVSALKEGETTITATRNVQTAERSFEPQTVASVTIKVTDKEPVVVPATGADANTHAGGSEPAPNGYAAAAVDGKSNTYWHSQWSGNGFKVSENNPAVLTVDLGKVSAMDGFKIQQRPSNPNGIVKRFSYRILDENKQPIAASNPIVVPAEQQRNGAWYTVAFDGTLNGRYIEISVLEGAGGFAALAEVQAYFNKLVATEATLEDLTIKQYDSAEMVLKPVGDTMLKGIVWSTENPDIIAVNQNGAITGLKAGTAKVVVTNAAGLRAEATVTVEARVLKEIEVSKQANKTDYIESESFESKGLQIVAVYKDGFKRRVTDWKVVDGENLTPDRKNVTVRYTDGDVTKETKAAITVQEVTLRDLKLQEGETKAMALDPVSDAVLKGLVWKTEDTDIIKLDQNGNVTGLKAGKATVTVTNDAGMTKTATVTVSETPVEVKLDEIKVTKNPNKTVYVEGEKFDATGMEISGFYSDGTKHAVSGWTVVDGDKLTVGQETVTIRYTEDGVTKEVTLKITVEKEKTPDGKPDTNGNNNQPARPGNGAATGDTTNMGLWIVLLVVSGALAAGAYYLSKKKSNKK